jgi:hypothetical protein
MLECIVECVLWAVNVHVHHDIEEKNGVSVSV